MKRIIKRISSVAVAAVMAATMMIIANAESCQHNSKTLVRSEIVSVNNQYYHYPHIQGAQVTCLVRDCVVKEYYSCDFCGTSIIVTNPHVIYHSINHS